MRIVLMRHGQPVYPVLEKLRARDIHQWVDAYNASHLKKEQTPPDAAQRIAKNCKVVVCSDLSRSLDSAQMLGLRPRAMQAVFREAGLPYVSWNSPKAAAVTWAGIMRVLWFFGYAAKAGESKNGTKERAVTGAKILEQLARTKESVLLVGHYWINRFIAVELLKRGWRGPTCPGKNHWDFGVYEHEPK